MQIICTSLQTYNHAGISSLNFLDRMLFVMSNQDCKALKAISYAEEQIKITRMGKKQSVKLFFSL